MVTNIFQLRTKTWWLWMAFVICVGLTAIYSLVSVDRESLLYAPKHMLPNCTFSDDFEMNLQKLENLSFPKSDMYMKNLHFNKEPERMFSSFPVIATGADFRYFLASQGVIKSVHEKLMPKYPGLKLIYYDLGLKPYQRQLLQKHCKCEVRMLPLPKLPKHVLNLRNYAFKPIIINLLYQEFGNVWWMDSSIRLLSSNVSDALDRLYEDNVYFICGESNLSPVPFHTMRATFKYFEEDPCNYLHFYEIQAGYVAFRKSRVASAILQKWVACALDRMCISPPGSVLMCKPDPEIMTEDLVGTCHRYDQSALNLILRRLYHTQNNYKMPNWMEIRGEQPVFYFPDQGSKSVFENVKTGFKILFKLN